MNRFVEISPLFRQSTFIPVHDREGRQHHRIAGHAPNIGPRLERREQLRTVGVRRLGVLAIQRLAPTGKEGFHGLVGQGIDPGVCKSNLLAILRSAPAAAALGQERLPRVPSGPSRHHQAALAISSCGILNQPREPPAGNAVRRLIETVQQHCAATLLKLPTEEFIIESQAAIQADLSQEMREPGG